MRTFFLFFFVSVHLLQLPVAHRKRPELFEYNTVTQDMTGAQHDPDPEHFERSDSNNLNVKGLKL